MIEAAGICEPCGAGCDPGLVCVEGVCQSSDEVHVCPAVRGGIWGLVKSLMSFLIYIAIALLPLIIIIGAFMLISAGGDPMKVSKIKRSITYAFIGLGIIFVGAAIIFFIDELYEGVI